MARGHEAVMIENDHFEELVILGLEPEVLTQIVVFSSFAELKICISCTVLAISYILKQKYKLGLKN